MLNFKLKSSILLSALVSISLQAQDYEVEDILPEKVQSEIIEKSASETGDTLVTAQAPERVKEVSETADILVADQISQPVEEALEAENSLAADQVSLPVEEALEAENSLAADQVSPPVEEALETENTVVADQVSPPVEENLETEDTLVADQISPPVEENLETEDTLVADHISPPNNISNTRSPTCPVDFYTLPLHPNAKFCQLFAEKLPASMSYFAVSDQQNAKDFYINQLGQAEDETMLKGRIVLQYSNGQTVVVISKDGQGSQIDILVKSAG